MIELIFDNITYLRKKTERAATPEAMLADLPNCYRAISDGLKFPALYDAAAGLLVRLLPLLERSGFTHAWIVLAEKALTRAETLAPGIVVRLHGMAGVLRRLERALPIALEHHHAALGVAQRMEEAHDIARSHFHLSTTLRELRDYAAARRHAEEALALWEPTDEIWRVATLNLLGRIATVQGHYSEAEMWLRQALVAGDALPNYEIENVRHRYNLALVMQLQGDRQEAHKFYDVARQRLDPETHLPDFIRLTISQASLYYQAKEYHLAEQLYRQLNFMTLDSLGFQEDHAKVMQGIGNVLLAQERYREAHLYLTEAITLWEALDEPIMLANSIGTRGEVFAAQGEATLARSDLTQAIHHLLPYAKQDVTARQALVIFEAALAALPSSE